MRDQLRSRRELRQRSGLGLGGGEDDTISLTQDENVGKSIERALHEARLVARGDLTVPDLITLSVEGAGSSRPWAADLASLYDSKFFSDHPRLEKSRYDPMKDGMPSELQWHVNIARGQFKLPSYYNRNDGGVHYQAEQRFSFYKYWAAAREHTPGGFLDPLFFGTDMEGLAKLDPKQFGVVEVQPRRGARGYQMGALGEWRTVGGENIPPKRAHHYYNADDWDAILGRRRG